MNIPEELHYTREHEWILVEDDTGTVGVTDHAQKELGDVVFVELPQRGEEIGAGEPFGSIESVKAVSEIYSPVSGQILETNSALQETPDKINSDPYGDGWIVRLRLIDRSEIKGLLSAQDYEHYLKEELAK
ncbi:MAG: glycine cleavage system protein GcvH [Acidobacteria bacterium]|nr:glycine cleavage system protein GcvH [Acidobacteriota bacterium]